MDGRVGLTPVPDDANIEEFLNKVQQDHDQELYRVLEDMRLTLEQTKEANEPAIFAYGKLLNYLASDNVPEPMRLKLLAAAIWELANESQV